MPEELTSLIGECFDIGTALPLPGNSHVSLFACDGKTAGFR